MLKSAKHKICFLNIMELSYYNLAQKEKEEISDMDFTYENWEKKH